MNIANLFPVPIATVMIDEKIIDSTLTNLKEFISKDENKKYLSGQPDEGHLVTTYYNDLDHNLLGMMNDKKLLLIINEEARKFLKLVGLDPDCYVEITTWMQLNPPKSLFNRHEHFGATLSGVIYLQVDDNCGDLTFFNPVALRTQMLEYVDRRIKHDSNMYNFETVKFTPQKGKMIIFESYLQHGVGVNLSNIDRYAISFNIHVDYAKR